MPAATRVTGFAPPPSSSSAAAAAASATVTIPDRLDGYLVKRGLRVKSWKRRFFSFREGVLTYRKSHREGAKALGRGDVTNVLYWGGVKHGFCVHLGSGRELFLSAVSEDEAALWYNVFDDFVRRQQRNKDFMRLMCKRQLDPIVESVWEC